MTIYTLETNQYSDFLSCLSNLKDICNDADIKGGLIRQRTNDLNTVFEFDLRSLGVRVMEDGQEGQFDIDLPISSLKTKLDLLKTFIGQASVTIELAEENDEHFYIFSDQFSSIKFRVPSAQFMDNPFIGEEELERIFDAHEEDVIVNTSISTMITDRIKIITLNFNTEAIQVNFDGDTAAICASTESKDQFAKLKGDITVNMDMDNCFSNLPTIPFRIEHDLDIEFKMYKVPSENISLNKLTTSLGGVEINMYTRSSLIFEE